MARKVIGPTGSRRRRWLFLLCLVVTAGSAVVFISGALANNVTLQTFELDGNIVQNHPGAPTTYDWANFFDAAGAKLALPTDYTASSFVRDFNTAPGRKPGSVVFDTSDTSTYTIGSKDTLDVNGWSCTPANNVTDKGDIMNAYATAYTAPGAGGHKFLYFAMERNANAGDANVAFWFLQGGNISCPAAGGSFTGTHHNGDLLIVSAFTNGGSVSTIDEYEWQNGALNTTPVAHGQDCRDATATNDPTCATSNTGTLNTPWLTENKADGVGHTLQTGEFFEGGIDLSAPSVNLASACFNTFVPDTRSSQSLTASLYDFAIGQLGECSSTTATTPVDATDNTKAPATSIPADPAGSNTEASVTVQDKTVITVSGISSFNSSNSQNLTWHICGPTDATTPSTQLCDGSTGSSTPACSTLPTISCVGVAVGSTSITAPGTYYSPTVTLTKAGRYCFRADFAGDSDVGVPGSSDSRSSECFTIAPQQPSLQTQATTGPVDFGQKISDTVTLSGTADEGGTGGPAGSDGSIGTVASPVTLGGDATGNINVVAYGPDSCNTVAFSSSTDTGAIAASGDGSYGGAGTNFEFQPSAPGQYVFVASYAGDSPNTKAIAASACSGAPDSEKVTVRKKPTSIATSQLVYPQDSATITDTISGDNLPAGGVVTFYLYGATTGTTPAEKAASALANCQAHGGTEGTGGLLKIFTATQSTAAPTFTADTNKQTSVSVSANTTVYWRDTYAPNNSAFLGIQSDCVENTATTFVNDSGPGTAFP
jgi:hypothetical protein